LMWIILLETEGPASRSGWIAPDHGNPRTRGNQQLVFHRRFWAVGRPSGRSPLHLSRGTARRPASGLFQAVRLATNLPLFPRRLQLPVLVTVRSVRVRLSRTIQGPKSQPESCFGRMCLTPEKRRTRPHGFQVSEYANQANGIYFRVGLESSGSGILMRLGRLIRSDSNKRRRGA
jgi:hypothetical protein